MASISQQEIQWQRQLAALKRAARGIGVSKDIRKSSYAQNGGNPNGPEEEEETVPEEKEPDMAARMRRIAKEAAKEAAKEVAKKAAKKLLKKAVEKGLMALLKNPYVLAAIGIIIGIIIILAIIVVIAGGGVTEEIREETRLLWTLKNFG